MRKIATKVLKRLKKAKANKIIELGEYRKQKKEVESLFDQIKTADDAIESGKDPLHAIYTHAQNLLSVLAEILQDVPEPALVRFWNTIEAAQEEYQTGGPPMSALTNSYFNCWLLLDVAVGLQKETLTTIIIDLAKELGIHQNMVDVFQHMQNSRMGIYEYLGNENGKILLREMTKDEVITCICPAGHQGQYKGELWFARILPPVFKRFDYSLVFTTPYILLNPDYEQWIGYLERTISKKKTKTTAASLENLMKYGLSDGYWNEYIHQAYVNFKPELIYLEGLPDVGRSRPHFSDSPKYKAILPETRQLLSTTVNFKTDTG